MSTTAKVNLWGRTIGAVSLEDGAAAASFEYDQAFIRSGIELAPLMMPLSNRLYSFPSLRRETFHGLPGLLADSLNGKRSGFTLEDFNACAKSASMKRGRAETIINEVRSVVARWRDYADESRVAPEPRDKIYSALRLESFD